MAIGPTGFPAFPPVDGQRGTVTDATERRADARASRAGTDRPQETVFAEPLDEADRRQFDLERTADQVRLLNPNAPRGSILNIVV